MLPLDDMATRLVARRSKAVITQNHGDPCVWDIDLPPLLQRGERSYSAEVRACQHDEQGWLIARLIDVAFGALGAEHLDVHVHPAER